MKMIARKKHEAVFDNIVLIPKLQSAIELSCHPEKVPGCIEHFRGIKDKRMEASTTQQPCLDPPCFSAQSDSRQRLGARSLVLPQVAIEEFDHDVKGVSGLRHVSVIEEPMEQSIPHM